MLSTSPTPRGRAFMEHLWRENACFLDANARHHARQDMPSVFWELYLAHSLRRAGVTLELENWAFQETSVKVRTPSAAAW